MPKRRQNESFKRGDRVRVLTWPDANDRGIVERRSPRPGPMYDVRAVDGTWSGTFFASSLRKVR